jgi:drug/metabolite transporter (DMT)-like permease
MSRSPVGAALLLAAVAVSWGAIPLIVRGDVPWQQLVAARIWLGAATLIAILAFQGRLRIPATSRGRILVSGVLLAVHWSSFFLSLRETTVAIALAVLYLGPVLASVAAPRVLGERPGRRVYVGLGLALVGVLAVVRPGGETSALGMAAAIVSGLTLAVLMLVAKPAAERLGGLVVAAGELTVASVVMTPFAVQAAVESRAYWLELIVLGAILTGVAGWIYWSAMRRLAVAAVSVIMYLEPASAVMWAVLFLDETPDLVAWAGIALVLAGGVLAGTAATKAGEEIGVSVAL